MSNLVQDELREVAKDPELARIYAKKNCRHCRGVGMITRSWPRPDGEELIKREVCRCVPKSIKKALKENDG